MSSHGAILSEDMIRALPSQVSKITQSLLLVVGIASTGISIAGEWSHGNHLLNSWLLDHVTIMGSILHLVLVVLVIFPGRIHLLSDELADQTVRLIVRCLNTFYLWAWTWFWVFLGLLYVVSLFMNMGSPQSHAVNMDGTGYPAAIRPAMLMDAFSVTSTYFMFLSFFFLSPWFLRRYVERLGSARCKQERARLARRANWPQLWVAAFFAFALLLYAIWARSEVLTCDDPVYSDKLISLVIGAVAAVALALFAGRMDSKFILNWQWVIGVLFLYSALQTYNSALYEDVLLNKAVFTYGAFTMKCVLFIFVSNFFESRRVIYYAVELVQAADRDL